MKKKTLANLLKAPLVLLGIGSFIASLYAAFNKIAGIGYGAGVLIGIIMILYFWGLRIENKRDSLFD